MDFYINISRFHSLFVHLPIGILMLGFMMECLNWWNKNDDLDKAIKLSLVIGFLFALTSVLTGLSLAEEGGYDLELLDRHKWLGISLLSFTALVLVANIYKNTIRKLYNASFTVLIVLLSVTGHFGGDLTHGSDYLFTKPVDQSITYTDINQELAYDAIIVPMLKKKCNGCHNPSKTKGDLIMTTYAELLAGGENGSILDFENPQQSELIKRIHLPIEDDKHMPPKGKGQLTENEIKLLQWWLSNKACNECIVSTMVGNDEIQPILVSYNSAAVEMNQVKIDPIEPSELTQLVRSGVYAYPESENSPLIIVSLSNRKDLTENLFEQISEIEDNIVELDLSNSNFSDEFASFLEDFKHLRRLQIQNTQITDKTIPYLTELKYLESLNIYGTSVTDISIENIKQIQALKNLYVWQTSIKDDAVTKLADAKPLLNIEYKSSINMFGGSRLKEPLFESSSNFFSDSVLVKLKAGFRNAVTYYTLDGTDPDSTSMVYSEPFYIRKTLELKAFSHKEGWEDSPIAKEQFIKGAIEPHNVSFLVKPSEKYPAEGVKSLIDLEKGSKLLADGRWLGYEANDMLAQFELKDPQELSEVFVSALSAQGNWIFFPKSIEVWTSMNGRDYDPVGEVNMPVKQITTPFKMGYFKVKVPHVKTKYVKIKVSNILKNPEWHPAPGGKSWIFIDEIALN